MGFQKNQARASAARSDSPIQQMKNNKGHGSTLALVSTSTSRCKKEGGRARAASLMKWGVRSDQGEREEKLTQRAQGTNKNGLGRQRETSATIRQGGEERRQRGGETNRGLAPDKSAGEE